MNVLFLLRKNLKELAQSQTTPNVEIFHKIPYFAQWESRDLIKKIIDKEVFAIHDPNWKQSGADTKEEYSHWSWNACGMACLKMIIAYLQNKNIPIVTLGKACKKYGGYKGKNLEGLFYFPFLNFIKKEFGLKGKVFSPLTIVDIAREMNKGNLIIASVSANIRGELKQGKAGGHLVLITGINTKKGYLLLHNPSGIDRKTQENFKILLNDFKKYFAFRGISIFP